MGNVFNYREQGLARGDLVAVVIAPTRHCLGVAFAGQEIALSPLASPCGGQDQAWGALPVGSGDGTPSAEPSLAEPCSRGDLPFAEVLAQKCLL